VSERAAEILTAHHLHYKVVNVIDNAKEYAILASARGPEATTVQGLGPPEAKKLSHIALSYAVPVEPMEGGSLPPPALGSSIRPCLSSPPSGNAGSDGAPRW
jgi:hypothetical protein